MWKSCARGLDLITKPEKSAYRDAVLARRVAGSVYRHLPQGRRVRVFNRDEGDWFPTSTPPEMPPRAPTAVPLYRKANGGHFAEWLCLDLDVGKHGAREVWRDAALLVGLADSIGLNWFADWSTSEGVHFYARIGGPRSWEEVAALQRRLVGSELFPTLDRSVMSGRAAMLTLPGSSNKNGDGYRALLHNRARLVRAIRRVPDSDVWRRLQTEVGRLPAPAIRLVLPLQSASTENAPYPYVKTLDQRANTPGARGDSCRYLGPGVQAGSELEDAEVGSLGADVVRMRPALRQTASTGTYEAGRYDSDSEARFAVIVGLRRAGWTLEGLRRALSAGQEDVAGYAALALNGKHGDDVPAIAERDWHAAEQLANTDRWFGRSPRTAEVPLRRPVGRWLAYGRRVVADSPRRYELEAVLEGIARIATHKGKTFAGSYRYVAMSSGIGAYTTSYRLVRELEELGLLVATNRHRRTARQPTWWTLDVPRGIRVEAAQSVPRLAPMWTDECLGWRARALWNLMNGGLCTMQALEQELGVSRPTLRTQLAGLDAAGVAKREGKSRWCATEPDGAGDAARQAYERWRAAADELARDSKAHAATYDNPSLRRRRTAPTPSDEWRIADRAFENALWELRDLRPYLTHLVEFGEADECASARKELEGLVANVERARVAKKAVEGRRRPDRRFLTDEELRELITRTLGRRTLLWERVDLDEVRATGKVIDRETGEVLCVL